MNKIKPLVSILLSVHNCEKYLSTCLKSLTSQSYKNIEIVAIDDNSKDNSFKILKGFAKKYKRIRVYRNIKNYGRAVTLNRLIKKAKSSLIAFMGSSDIAYTHRIKKQVKFILENPGVVAVGSQCKFINDKNRPLGKSKFPLFRIFSKRSRKGIILITSKHISNIPAHTIWICLFVGILPGKTSASFSVNILTQICFLFRQSG